MTVIRCGISAPGRLVHRTLPPSAGARSPACRHAAGTWPGQASEAGPEGGSEAAGPGAVVS